MASYKCDLCSKEYKYKRNLTRHIQEKHFNNKVWKCVSENCNAKFIRRSYLSRHLMWKHEYDPATARKLALETSSGAQSSHCYYENISSDEDALDMCIELDALDRNEAIKSFDLSMFEKWNYPSVNESVDNAKVSQFKNPCATSTASMLYDDVLVNDGDDDVSTEATDVSVSIHANDIGTPSHSDVSSIIVTDNDVSMNVEGVIDVFATGESIGDGFISADSDRSVSGDDDNVLGNIDDVPAHYESDVVFSDDSGGYSTYGDDGDVSSNDDSGIDVSSNDGDVSACLEDDDNASIYAKDDGDVVYDNNVGDTGDDVGDEGDDVGDAGDDVGDAGDNIGDTSDDVGDAGDDVGDAGDNMGDASDDVGYAGDDVGDAGDDVSDASDDVGDASDDVGDAIDDVGDMGDYSGDGSTDDGEHDVSFNDVADGDDGTLSDRAYDYFYNSDNEEYIDISSDEHEDYDASNNFGALVPFHEPDVIIIPSGDEIEPSQIVTKLQYHTVTVIKKSMFLNDTLVGQATQVEQDYYELIK